MNDTTPHSTSAANPDQPAPAQVAPPPPALAEANPGAPADPQPSTTNSQPIPQATGESDRAFEAFCAYLTLGPKRRYAAVGKTVGASLRTIKRWAIDFDWRSRIKTCAAQSTQHFIETESSARCEDVLDAAARAKSFRDRKYALAEAFLDATERYLEQVDTDDLDLMSFGDACKASEVAVRLGENAADKESGDPAAPANALRDQITTLLDQAYGEFEAAKRAGTQPGSPTPT